MEKKELLARAMEGFNAMPNTDIVADMVGMLFDPEIITLITETDNPHAIAGIKLLEKRARDFNLIETAETYKTYIQNLQEAFLSYKRQSREEITEIAKSTQYQEPESLAEQHEMK